MNTLFSTTRKDEPPAYTPASSGFRSCKNRVRFQAGGCKTRTNLVVVSWVYYISY